MLTAPAPLNHTHVIATFDSGVASLDDSLKRRAMHNQLHGASRTFVTCEGTQIAGYYALASSAVALIVAPGRFKRNMPDPIPVVVLGRLAVARAYQGRGVGRGLFQDAARRVLQAAETIGIRGLLVHALTDDARGFYLNLGLEPSPLEPMTLMVTLAQLRGALAE